jgi:3-deoxy-D-manno-octulosonate 8-phosphate phosphatase (KDO 8-P phosphatase)
LLEKGLQARSMNIKDGYALQLAVNRNYRILIVSGADGGPVDRRMNKLGIDDVHMSVKDKKALVQKYMKKHKLRAEEVLYMGDDMPDLPVMSVVGLPACPADAVPEIKEASKYVSPFNGGYGCARDVIEKVLKLNGHWNTDHPPSSK